MAWRSIISREYILPERVQIFDTTLRDGEQTPGVALTKDNKIEIAKALDELGVDVIELGFPIVSKGEEEAIKEIVKENLRSKTCVLARANKLDIDKAIECEADWVHIFIATSDIHLKHKLKMSREEVIEKATRMVEYAKDHNVTIHFSAEDATRTDLDYLVRVFKAVEEVGADSIDIPDTVGFAVPSIIRMIVSTVKKSLEVPIAIHCHDDMGLAVANSLTAVESGAEIIHATINGIGERAGNASLEEIVVALHTLYGVKTNVKLEKIYGVSRLVEKLTGIIVPKNKAIVGENAFSHESGIHVHGVISSPQTYEPIEPERVGRKRKIILGKHSGKHSVMELARQFGVRLNDDQAETILREIKNIGDLGHKINEIQFLEMLVGVTDRCNINKKAVIKDICLHSTETGTTALLHLNILGEDYVLTGFGRNEIEALTNIYYTSLERTYRSSLSDYRVWLAPIMKLVSESEVILCTNNNDEIVGRGIHHSHSIAFAQALINALNQLLEKEEMRND
ncbi:MAG: 2-isopropylmalate synthase [Thaumarchaeota archaeon]|jgi:2-isopropylmalate synthase|nr:2-isopropylmalate synthase [Candidatus Geocrenenecus arthurdayi]